MKTPEDEAFDDLAKRQGAWGGGFPAKRKMVMDKIHAEFYEKYVRYRTAFPKGYTAPQPAQEPVAWITPDGEGFRIRFSPPTNDVPLSWDALYTAPPQREWVGLTDAEIDEGNKQSWVTKQAWESAVWWASEKLKEKNNG